jgi:peptidoglycan/xylan/chitin deacetylase (PgdA/CDA1 family)
MRKVILFGLVAAPVIALGLLWWSPWASIIVLMVSHALLLYPTLRANVQWLGPVFTRFEPRGNEVWLTIDDGPTDDTPAVLDALEAGGARATFFVKGVLAEKNADLLREIVRRGHDVGNHSWSHPSGTFWCLPPARIRSEIDDANKMIETVTGRKPSWFRAPVGMKNPFVHPALDGMPLIGWTARAFDGVSNDADAVVRRLLAGVEPGAILLLHQGRPASAQIIGRVVGELRRRSYSLVVPEVGRLKTNR